MIFGILLKAGNLLSATYHSRALSWNKRVFEEGREVIEKHSRSKDQRNIANHFLEGAERSLKDQVTCIINLPLEICLALEVEESDAIKIATTALFVYLAADIADDIADGDFQDNWGSDISMPDGFLSSVLYSSSFGPLVVGGMSINEPKKLLIKETISRGILEMAAGQHGDFGQSVDNCLGISDDWVIENVKRKSGGEIALFAEIAAQASPCGPEIMHCLKVMGASIGTANQLISDCSDLCLQSVTSDLASGKLTLPVVRLIQNSTSDEQVILQRLLCAAENDVNAREEVKALAIKSGALTDTNKVIKWHKHHALEVLENTGLSPEKTHFIREVIAKNCSLA